MPDQKTTIAEWLRACGWRAGYEPDERTIPVWQSIRSAGIEPTFANGPWVTCMGGQTPFVTGLSHLPAVASALDASGIGYRREAGVIEVRQ